MCHPSSIGIWNSRSKWRFVCDIETPNVHDVGLLMLNGLVLIALPGHVVSIDTLSGCIRAEGFDSGRHNGNKCSCYAVGTSLVRGAIAVVGDGASLAILNRTPLNSNRFVGTRRGPAVVPDRVKDVLGIDVAIHDNGIGFDLHLDLEPLVGGGLWLQT